MGESSGKDPDNLIQINVFLFKHIRQKGLQYHMNNYLVRSWNIIFLNINHLGSIEIYILSIYVEFI